MLRGLVTITAGRNAFWLATFALATAAAYGWLYRTDNQWGWDGWGVSELHVNYASGFVRRGLLGQFGLWLSEWAGIAPLRFFRFVLAVTYASVGLLMLRASALWRFHPWLLALVWLAPPLLLFPVYDGAAFLRKDAFFNLAILLHAVAWKSTSNYAAFVRNLLMPILVVTTLIHEAQIFFLGFHAALVWLRTRSLLLACWLAIPAFAGLVLAGIPVTSSNAQTICSAWGTKPIPCEAIFALAWSPDATLNLPRYYIQDAVTMLRVGLLALLSALPPAAIFWISGGAVPALLPWLGLATLGALPLFAVAYDWGRWLHLLSMHWTVVLLIATTPHSHRVLPRCCKVAALVLLIAYLTLWRLPHAGLPDYLMRGGALSEVWFFFRGDDEGPTL